MISDIILKFSYFQSSCAIDVTYFPFDQQTCIMKFGSWTFTGDQVSLSLFNNKNHVDLSDYWKSGTWDIIEVPAYLNVHNTTGEPKKICLGWVTDGSMEGFKRG